MNDKVSVIIPVFNRQDYIEECIQSVAGQSHKNLEIIVIDDGSTDQTADICRHMSQEDPRIKLIEGMHKGVSEARNIGINAATGEYIFFIDSDDVVHPRILEVLMTAMNSASAPVGGSLCRPIRAKNWRQTLENIMDDDEVGETECLSDIDALNATFTSKTPLSMIGGVMMNRQWVGNTRFRTDLTIGEDYYFIYENMIKGASAVFLKPRWYFNRLHDKNTSWNYGYDGFMTRFLRRKLVWESEESFGRTENAIHQKNEIFGIYLTCVRHSGVFCDDARKMRSTLKEYRKILLPAMKFRLKAAFLFTIYIPSSVRLVFWIQKKKRIKAGKNENTIRLIV